MPRPWRPGLPWAWRRLSSLSSPLLQTAPPSRPGRLAWLVAECDRRGLVVDVSLTRRQASSGGADTVGLPDFQAHQRAVETLIEGLRPHRNWYLDLANERDVRDARYVSPAELKSLRELARRLNPQLLVTASFGGHDLAEPEVRDALLTVGVKLLLASPCWRGARRSSPAAAVGSSSLMPTNRRVRIPNSRGAGT